MDSHSFLIFSRLSPLSQYSLIKMVDLSGAKSHKYKADITSLFLFLLPSLFERGWKSGHSVIR